MGVDISNILEKKSISLEELSGKRLAIDAYNTLYQFLTIIRQPDGTPLMDSKGRITSHLTGLFYRMCNLLEKNIQPVFVFDGVPSDLKAKTIEKRSDAKVEAEKQRITALREGNIERAGRLAQRTARLTKEHVGQAKQLLDLMGVPHVQAASEGEAQCAAMAKEGLVNAAASQDYDTLLFGAPLLVRNLTIAGKRKVPRTKTFTEILPEEINLEENLKTLQITREKLIWIGMLCGTDFNEGIHGIGPKKSLKLVQKHEKFDDILQEIKKEMDWKPVYDLFAHPPEIEVKKSDIAQREPNRDGIVKFMHGEFEFSLDRVQNAIQRAFKEPEDSNQSQLKKWF